MQRRQFTTALLCASGMAAQAQPAAADPWPQRPITLVVPYAAGGGLDAIARALAEELSRRLRQTVVVDNRAGAAGMLGTGMVARAPADGYTLLLTLTPAILTNLFVFKKVGYDPRRDLAFVAELFTGTVVMLTHAQVPADTPRQLLDWMAKHPDRANYGSWGLGSFPHLAASHLSASRQVPMTHVPYKGEAPILQDLMGGQLTLAFGSLGSARPLIESGRLKALAVTGARRNETLPTVPTLSEAGFDDPELVPAGSAVFMAPAATPKAVLALIEREVLAAAASAGVRSRLQTFGFIPLDKGAVAARASYEAMYPVQERLIRSLNITAE